MSRYLKPLFLFLLIHFSFTTMWSQIVWPGDINDNGIVNNVDWVYLQAAMGETGPARPVDEMGIEWDGMSITSLWGSTIPGLSLDYVYADCDGSGEVDMGDFLAIDENYGLEHGAVDVDVAIQGEESLDPQLFFEEISDDPFPQGGVLFLELNFGTAAIPVDIFTGISFSIEYDPAVVMDLFFIPIDMDGGAWADAELITYQRNIVDQGRIEFAITSMNVNNIESPFGVLGRLFIVIEDDVVGMQDPGLETQFLLENVILFGENLTIEPVVNDTVTVTIVADPLDTDDLIDEKAVEIFPNPVLDHLYLKTELNVKNIELYNCVGQMLDTFSVENSNLQKIELPHFKTGIYFLKIYTEKGILTKKIILN